MYKKVILGVGILVGSGLVYASQYHSHHASMPHHMMHHASMPDYASMPHHMMHHASMPHHASVGY